MSAYDNVIELCRGYGVPQTILEKELGFSRGSIGKMRTSNMTHERLQKIADYFHVSVDYLLTGKDTPKESQSGKIYYFDDETAEAAQELFESKEMRLLFDAAKGSRPEDLKMAEDFLRRLKETNPEG